MKALLIDTTRAAIASAFEGLPPAVDPSAMTLTIYVMLENILKAR